MSDWHLVFIEDNGEVFSVVKCDLSTGTNEVELSTQLAARKTVFDRVCVVEPCGSTLWWFRPEPRILYPGGQYVIASGGIKNPDVPGLRGGK